MDAIITRSFARLYYQSRLRSPKTFSPTKNILRPLATTSVCSYKEKYTPGKRGFGPGFDPGPEWYTRPINSKRRVTRGQKMRRSLESQLLPPRDVSESTTEATRYRSRLAAVKRDYANQLISHLDERDVARKKIQQEEVKKRIDIKDTIETKKEEKEISQHDVLENLNLTSITENPDQTDEVREQHHAKNREEHLGHESRKRLKLLLKIYHQAPKFITMENLESTLDEFFHSRPIPSLDDIGSMDEMTPPEVRDKLIEERIRELSEILDGVTIIDKKQLVGVDKVLEITESNKPSEAVDENLTPSEIAVDENLTASEKTVDENRTI